MTKNSHAKDHPKDHKRAPAKTKAKVEPKEEKKPHQKETVAIVDANSAQGYSAVKYIVKKGRFNVKALVRDMNGVHVDALKKKRHVEVVKVNFDSVKAMEEAFEDCACVFAAFDEKEYADPVKGLKLGQTMVDAARKANIDHFIWSTMDAHTGISIYETISEVDQYLKSSRVPRTSLYTSISYEQFKEHFCKKQHDGTLSFQLPVNEESKIPMYYEAEVGAWVAEVMEHPQIYIHKDVDVAAEFISPLEMKRAFEQVLPELKIDFKYTDDLPVENKHLQEALKFFQAHPESSGVRDAISCKRMYPKATDFHKFVKGAKWEESF
ncbi:hypothetical protein HK103_007122 [Boothiomyces macroporosus]|uniref:NmrA-like domain-containing protein n=1 Tax=Boothiomyces macroporosus TaxID=261099 RepID=A0AAD5UCX5_9FUNG|nr:hypothetical protein HK103_007122 [Boothiomyces macroporosus]